jgi:hypothetical protein
LQKRTASKLHAAAKAGFAATANCHAERAHGKTGSRRAPETAAIAGQIAA